MSQPPPGTGKPADPAKDSPPAKDSATPNEPATPNDSAPPPEAALNPDVLAGQEPGTDVELPVTDPGADLEVRHGMFGVDGTGDTSGYGRLVRTIRAPASAPRPYGSYFDLVADALGEGLAQREATFEDAIEKVVVFRGEITFHVRRAHLAAALRTVRDDEALRFELLSSLSGVHYPQDEGRELHVVYELRSLTHNRNIRLEVSAPDADPHIPSATPIYPTADWHERETYDFFGVIFDGHPALTRIEMPDDWAGHPQRKDYPLGGIDVEYKGATIPSPDHRRSYN
jgi:NADH-quinone oxidoreductase subunit C